MERLTPLQERDVENANVWGMIEQLQGSVTELQAENEDLKAEKASWGTLPEDLANKDAKVDLLQQEVDLYKQHTDQLQDLLENLLRNRDEDMHRYQLEATDARRVIHKESGPAPLDAPKKAESKERANPQPEQSVSNIRAEELESQTSSSDATEGEFETVKDKMNKWALDPGSKATTTAGSAFSRNPFWLIDPEDPYKKKIGQKKTKLLNPSPTEQRYVSPPPDTVISDVQNRFSLRASAPSFIPASPAGTSSSILSGTGVWSLGNQHPKGHAFISQGNSAHEEPSLSLGPLNSPQPEDVRPLTTPHQPEFVQDYAKVAAEPMRPAWASASIGWLEDLGQLIKKRNTAKGQKPAEPSKSSESPTLGVDGSSTSRKRSLSQTSSVPDHSQKKPKPTRREFSPPTTPAEADVNTMRTAPREKEFEGGKSEG